MISSRFNESTNGNRIRFTNLPQQCTINIYTISGEFVKSIEHDDNFKGSVFWNLKNTSDKSVAPGLYIYILETNNGLSKVGKFAVVR
jgi:flagellar hook assembly protein FlgD